MDETLKVGYLSRKDIARVFSKIVVGPKSFRNTLCWNWTACSDDQGYGYIAWKQRNTPIHRLMFAWLVQPIPRGHVKQNGHRLELDHLCQNKACCNPAHLELVSRRTNVLRGTGLAAQNAAKTHCKMGHLFSDPSVCYSYKHKTGRIYRKCRKCASANDLAAYHRKKEVS